MRFETKQRIVRTVVWALALWPLLHFGVVRVFDLNPWKFLGFAMYAVPVAQMRVNLVSLRDGQAIPFKRDEVSEELMRAAFRYSELRLDLGKLAKPDRIAKGLLEENPELDGVRIEVGRSYIDRRDGILKFDYQTYDYFRDGEQAARGGRG
jgi:hypothetical protein